MAKAKIKIVTANRQFSQSEIDSIRRSVNCFTQLNLSVSVEFNESVPVTFNGYIMPGDTRLLRNSQKSNNLKVKRNTKKSAS